MRVGDYYEHMGLLFKVISSDEDGFTGKQVLSELKEGGGMSKCSLGRMHCWPQGFGAYILSVIPAFILAVHYGDFTPYRLVAIVYFFVGLLMGIDSGRHYDCCQNYKDDSKW